jgi:hypothetical protein
VHAAVVFPPLAPPHPLGPGRPPGTGFANKGRAGGAPAKISDESRQLFEKIEDGDMAAVGELLAAGADTGAIWESSPSCERAPCQPLHTAVVAKRSEAVALLAAAGAPLDGLDKKKRTSLHLACTHGLTELTTQLLELGAKTELTNEAGATPLYIAISEGHLGCVRALLEFGADASTSNKKGQPALMNALFWNHGEIAVALIEAGADLDAADVKGKTFREKLAKANPKLQALIEPVLAQKEAEVASKQEL